MIRDNMKVYPTDVCAHSTYSLHICFTKKPLNFHFHLKVYKIVNDAKFKTDI